MTAIPFKEPLKVRTVEVECIVKGDAPSYLVGGVRQEAGDRARFPIDEARGLERAGKCRIVPDSEKVESLGFPPADPPRPKVWWKVSNW